MLRKKLQRGNVFFSLSPLPLLHTLLFEGALLNNVQQLITIWRLANELEMGKQSKAGFPLGIFSARSGAAVVSKTMHAYGKRFQFPLEKKTPKHT